MRRYMFPFVYKNTKTTAAHIKNTENTNKK